MSKEVELEMSDISDWDYEIIRSNAIHKIATQREFSSQPKAIIAAFLEFVNSRGYSIVPDPSKTKHCDNSQSPWFTHPSTRAKKAKNYY